MKAVIGSAVVPQYLSFLLITPRELEKGVDGVREPRIAMGIVSGENETVTPYMINNKPGDMFVRFYGHYTLPLEVLARRHGQTFCPGITLELHRLVKPPEDPR